MECYKITQVQVQLSFKCKNDITVTLEVKHKNMQQRVKTEITRHIKHTHGMEVGPYGFLQPTATGKIKFPNFDY